jgi:hypothetical protein
MSTSSRFNLADVASLRRRLAEAEENLRLIKERKAEYVMSTDFDVYQLTADQSRNVYRDCRRLAPSTRPSSPTATSK